MAPTTDMSEHGDALAVPLSTRDTDEPLSAVLHATRALLWMTTPADASAAAMDLIRELGGQTVAALEATDDALAVDVSFGVDQPVLPSAPPSSVARMLLERHLPLFVRDAQRALELFDQTSRRSEGDHQGQPRVTTLDTKGLTLLAIDHSWCLTEMTADSAQLLGWVLASHRGAPLKELVHPEDGPLFLRTLVRSSLDRRAAGTRLRVRGLNDVWATVRMVVSPLCAHSPARFAVGIWVQEATADHPESPEDRSARLESHLWRIAVELQAAGIDDYPRAGHIWWSDPRLSRLSTREWEVLRRLVRGHRGPAIASDLHVSQSTVRNHLSAIYRKMGVHSHTELLASLLPADFRDEPTP